MIVMMMPTMSPHFIALSNLLDHQNNVNRATSMFILPLVIIIIFRRIIIKDNANFLPMQVALLVVLAMFYSNVGNFISPFWVFWGLVRSIKVVSEFWFGHPKCHFWYPQNSQKHPKWPIFGVFAFFNTTYYLSQFGFVAIFSALNKC